MLPPRPTKTTNTDATTRRPRRGVKGRDGAEERTGLEKGRRAANEVEGKAGCRQPGSKRGSGDSSKRCPRLTDASKMRRGCAQDARSEDSHASATGRIEMRQPVSVQELLSDASSATTPNGQVTTTNAEWNAVEPRGRGMLGCCMSKWISDVWDDESKRVMMTWGSSICDDDGEQ